MKATENEGQARLGLFDAVSIILGIIIGATIYETPRTIFNLMPSEAYTYGIWAFCGLLALIGALCYAELATAYPRSGGDYVYHTRAYGPFMGYLFGWTQLAVIQTGSIGLMAYVFADYGHRLWPIPGVDQYSTAIYAAGAILVMSLLNIAGVVLGKLAQNLLTLAKVLGLGGIVVVGFVYAPQHEIVFDGTIAAVDQEKVVLSTSGGDKSFQLTEHTKYLIRGSEVLLGKDGKALKDDEGEKIKVTLGMFGKDMFVRVVADLKQGNTVRKLKATPAATEGKIAALDKDKVVVSTEAGEKSFALTKATDYLLKGKGVFKDPEGKEYPVTTAQFDKDMNVQVVTAKEGGPATELKDYQPLPWTFGGLLASMAFPFVLVLLAYGGWNDAAFVAAEVKNRSRNIPLALIIGTAGVTVIYLLVNAAYLFGLGGFRGAQEAGEVAADVLSLLPWEFSEKAMCILVMVSALGAVNGLIFTSSRIYSTLGSDYSLFSPLGIRNSVTGSPVFSLLLQMSISLLMVLGVGTATGHEILNEGLKFLGQKEVDDWAGQSGFNTLLKCTAPIFWIFFLLTACAVFILRINDPHLERPFRVPLYPVLPLIFCLYCGYMVYSGINFAGSLGLVGAVLVLAGFPLYVFSRRSNTSEPTMLSSSE